MIPIRHFFLGLCLMCLSTGQAAAQSYARLWKDAQAAMNDDKPKTALQTVERIVAKATAERQEAQLLKGVLVQLQLHQDIAPDSAKKMLRQLEETAGRPDGMTPEAAALWRSAAGQLCMKQWGDTAAVSQGLAAGFGGRFRETPPGQGDELSAALRGGERQSILSK